MSEQIKAIRGMRDLLPEETGLWQRIESVLRELMHAYGYGEIRVPVLERTELFQRSIGEVTDIVEKEMYTFRDRNDESLTLRPEATAGIVRAGITNSMLHNQRHKLWFTGPMFRYERPQKGRYRQFYQFSIEALGYAGPDVDAELIVLTSRLWEKLGLEAPELQLNSLGTVESRARYRDALHEYFSGHKDALDEDSLSRLDRSPMRILDSKNPALADIIAGAPQITEYLDDESAAHFVQLQERLTDAGISFTLNPRLVRGLDYYTRTVFEWVTDKLGAQGAVCAGGRYDGLVEHLGGKPTPAVGCAVGLDRVVALCEQAGIGHDESAGHVYIVAVGDAAARRGFTLAEEVRAAYPGMRVDLNADGGSFKSQFKRADKSGAGVAIILGDEELAAGKAGLKPLRSQGEQSEVPLDNITEALATLV